MKQVFELGVMAPSGCKLEDFQGVYQSGKKLIVLAKLSKGDGGNLASISYAAVEIDVPSSSELPIECYIIADCYWGTTDRSKKITEKDVPKLIKGLTSLKITKIVPEITKPIHYEEKEEKPRQCTGLSRNTLFAVSVVTGITVACAGVAMTMTNRS